MAEVFSKRQLAWQCRRGMLELDVLLARFLDRRYESLSAVQQQDFVALLRNPDPVLFAWLMGQEAIPAEFSDIIHAIKSE